MKNCTRRGSASRSIEGANGTDWVLIDAGDIIVHLFKPESRGLYGLEKMWSAELDEAGEELRLLAIGKAPARTPESEIFARYAKRIKPGLTLVEFADGVGSAAEIKRREAEALLAALKPDEFVIALDQDGVVPTAELSPAARRAGRNAARSRLPHRRRRRARCRHPRACGAQNFRSAASPGRICWYARCWPSRFTARR